jgi:ribose transport system permease protein
MSISANTVGGGQRTADGAGAPGSPSGNTPLRWMRAALGTGLGRYSGVLVWALLIVVFAVWVPSTFLTQVTFRSILGGQSVTAILALGVLFAFSAGQFDLSAAQNLGLSAEICGGLIIDVHLSWPLAALLTVIVGAAIGAVNGAIVLLGVNSFIATLGMSSVLLAITEEVGGSSYIGPLPNSFQSVANSVYLGIPVIAWYTLILAMLIWYVLEHSPIGRRTQATGANIEAARLAGVRTTRYSFWSLVVCGAVAALAGVLLAAQIGTVSSTIGPPYLLPAFAACLLGTTQVKIGRFNVWGTLVALLLLATGVWGVQLVSGQLWYTDLFNGVALIAAVSISVWASKRKTVLVKGRRDVPPASRKSPAA